LKGLNASPARFDYDKLDWMNGVYVRESDADVLAEHLLPFYLDAGLDADLDTVRQIVPLIRERIKKLADVVSWSGFIFRDDLDLDPALLIGKKMDAASSLNALRQAREVVAEIEPFTSESLEQPLRDLARDLGVKVGSLFGVIRGAVTGQKVSPPLFETMEIMGRQRICKQMDEGIVVLEQAVTSGS